MNIIEVSNKKLEKEFKDLCGLDNCHYEKIPDAIVTNASNRAKHRPKPCDGILSTKKGNFCLEFKANKGDMKKHQKDYHEQVNAINNMHFVVRVIEQGQYADSYTIEKLGFKIFKTEKFNDLLRFFQ